jgi:hypothetical protein
LPSAASRQSTSPRVVTSGSLAGRPIAEMNRASLPIWLSEGIVTYQVKVDNTTGRVIWFERQGNQALGESLQAMNQFIGSIRFEKAGSKGSISSGIVELIFDSNGQSKKRDRA